MKGKFPESFEEAMQWARLKDRKLQFQAHVMRRESQPSTSGMGEQQPHAPPTAPADPHLELLQRVTNQLNELSVNMFQGSRMPAQPSNEERAQNAQQSRREDNKEGRIISATTVERTGMVCIFAHTQEDILEMDKEEDQEDK